MIDMARWLGLRPRPRGISGQRTAIAVAVILSPGLASAGAWDVFVDRCLAPMSEVAPADTTGLSEGGREMAAEHFEADKLALMQTFAVAEGITLVLQPGDFTDTPNCLVLTDDDGADRADADAWLADVVAAGSWAFAGDGFLGAQHDSTTWREPKLRFTLVDPDGPRVIFALTETDLES
jgi:hypothetical protein